jgi:hypothetical protein
MSMCTRMVLVLQVTCTHAGRIELQSDSVHLVGKGEVDVCVCVCVCV